MVYHLSIINFALCQPINSPICRLLFSEANTKNKYINYFIENIHTIVSTQFSRTPVKKLVDDISALFIVVLFFFN